MEQRKAENMLQYDEEIKARPHKQWFQSNKEKLASKGWFCN
jgi:hypothetical protein